MELGKKILIVTNPMLIPIGIGILLGVVIKNLFGGVYKDCKMIAEDCI